MADVNVEDVKETVEEGEEKLTGNGGGGNGLVKRYAIPAAAGIGTLAATYAARKAPELVRDKLMPKVEEKGGEEAAKMGEKALDRVKNQGGVGGLAAKAFSIGGGKSGKGGGGGKKTRRLPIQRWTDIAAPRATVYDKWTQFEEYPKFMHRVLSVQQDDDDENKIKWEEKIWFSKRQWEGEITEREKNDRVAWKTVSGTSHEGVVSFHKLDDKLTRVMVDLDFHPSGMIEKMGSGMRFVKRAVQADLARFKSYVELGEAEGLEYSHETEAGGDKQDKQDKKQDKQEDENKKESNGDGQQSRSQSRSQSSGNGSGSGSEKSEEEQEKAREERAERREQRRS
jgi:uncharacterized membrane protein